MEFTWRHWLIQHMSETEVHSYVVTPFFFPHSSKPCLPTSQIPQVLIASEGFRTERARSRDSEVALACERDGGGCEGNSTTTADILVSYSCPPTQLKFSPAFSGTGHSPELSSGLRTSLNPCRHHNLEWHFNHIRESRMGLPGQGFFTCSPCTTGGPQHAWRWSAGWLQLRKWSHTHCIPMHASQQSERRWSNSNR